MDGLNTAFPWIGLVGAVVLLGLLAGNGLRGTAGRSRWRDLPWLSWLGVATYLLHNFEEYGIDLRGQAHAFPAAFCAMFGFAAPACPVPDVVFTAVNVPMFWLAAPLAAGLSRRYPLTGLAIYGVIAVNLVAHVGEGLAKGLFGGSVYNPGELTAMLLFLPLALWTLVFSRSLTRPVFVWVIASGVAVHLILIGSMQLLVTGVLHDPAPVIGIQLLNAALLVLAPLLAERRLGRHAWRTA